MAITESSIIQPGTRVAIRRGTYPADPALVGRRGTVVLNSQYDPRTVEVALDDDPDIRTFAASEIELLEPGLDSLPGDQAAARKRLARP
jgi:hypothetical protein